MSSGPTAKIRLVRCPKCRQVLLESPDVPVYECGGCGTRLQAKFRNNNAHGTAPGLQENGTAQTGNLDRSPEGMDSSPSHGAIHPSEEGSQDQINETDQRVAGDCNSKQLSGVELSCEDENRRIDQNGSGHLTSMQPLGVNLLKDQNDRSVQNESADCCNEPVGGVNFPNEDEKQKTYKHRFPDCNDDRLGSSREVESQNEVEDCNQDPIEAVNLPNEVHTNVTNESEDCEQEQAEAKNLPNKRQNNATNTSGSSGFSIKQPEFFSEIQNQNEGEGCNSGHLRDVNCNNEQLGGVHFSNIGRDKNVQNEASEYGDKNVQNEASEYGDTLVEVCSTSQQTFLQDKELFLLAGENSAEEHDGSPSLLAVIQKVGDLEISSDLRRSFPEGLIDDKVSYSNAVPCGPAGESISSGIRSPPNEYLEQHLDSTVNTHCAARESISSDSIISSPNELMEQRVGSAVNSDSPAGESISSDTLGSTKSEQQKTLMSVLQQGEDNVLSDISISSPNEHLKQPKENVNSGFNRRRSVATFESTDFIDPSSELSSTPIDLSKSSTTKSYHAYYDDGFSSYEGADDQVPNRHKHSFRNAHKPPNYVLDEKRRKAKFLVNNSSEMQHHLRSYAAVMSNEAQYGIESINLEQDEFVDQQTLYPMKSSKLDRDELLEPTRLAQNWRQYERDGGFHSRLPFYGSGKSSNHLNNQLPWSSSFQPQDKAAYAEHEKMKLLRMIYELQDQLDITYLPHENANDRIPPGITGSKRPPLYYDQEVAEHESLHDLNYQRHPERFREESKWSQQSKYSRIPFSAEATYSRHQVDHSLCCCPQDSYSSTQFPPRGPQHNGGFCKVHPHINPYNTWGSCPASPQRYVESDYPQRYVESDYPSHSRRPKSGDQWQRDYEVKKYMREKLHLARRHLRPIAGGAPFLTCPSCLKLVKLPEEFLLFRRRCHKLKCGACSQILKFSLVNRSHLVPYMPTATTTANAPPPSEVDEYSDALNSRNFTPMSHARDHSQAGPVSFSEDYGVSVCNSCSTDEAIDGNAVGSDVPLTDNKRRGQFIPNENQERRKSLAGMYDSPSHKPSSSMSKSKKANSDVEEVRRRRGGGGGGGSPLHRLMGYASPSQVIKGVSPFDPENELS